MADVLHRDLINGELHETKGIDVADSGDLLVATGGGAGDWTDLTTIGLVTDAPVDGSPYVRQDLGWALAPIAPNVLYYKFSDSVGPTPAAGTFTYDNANQALATEIYFSNTDSTGRDVVATLAFQRVGDILFLSNQTNTGDASSWDIDSVTTETGYVTFGVTSSVFIAPFTDGLDVVWNTLLSSLLDLTLVDLTGKANNVLAVTDAEDGFELVDRSVYGVETFYEENLSLGTEASQLWKVHVDMDETFEAGKTYDIMWTATIGTLVTNKNMNFRVQVDGTPIHELGAWQGVTIQESSGQRRIVMDGGAQNITIEFMSADVGTSGLCFDASIKAISVDV